MRKKILNMMGILFAFTFILQVKAIEIPAQKSITIDGKMYLPLKVVTEEVLQVKAIWDQEKKQYKIVKDDKVLILKVSEDKGKYCVLMKNDVAYVQARLLKEDFNLEVIYDKNNKKINIKEPKINILPKASFKFEANEYIQGQEIKIIDTSYDEEGEKITDRLWMVNNNESKLSSQFDEIFSNPLPGIYEVFLKVKDASGGWSEWTSQTITIKENVAPVIKEYTSSKKEYGIGEEIQLTYQSENEPWEAIVEERWSYRKVGEDQDIVYEKPRAIFASGDYIITLQLKDEYGNLSDVAECPIHINTTVVESEFHYKFSKEGPGSIIDNYQKIEYQKYKELTPTEIIDEKGPLILSNSPEKIKKKGILYRDTVSGTGKFVIHHINGSTSRQNDEEPKRMMIIAQNKTQEPIMLTIGKKSIKGPAQDVLFTGQKALEDYFESDIYTNYTIKPGQAVTIYDTKGRKWESGETISGIFQFVSEGDVTLTIAVGGPHTKVEDIDKMPVLERDSHIRGTFDTINRYYRLDLTNVSEASKLVIGKGADEWLTGYDALTGENVINLGNFGLCHYIKITTKQSMGILLNPRGGFYRGAVRWVGGSILTLPKNGYFTYKNKAVVVGKIDAYNVKELIYMLPNGSAAPVLLGFIPESEWTK